MKKYFVILCFLLAHLSSQASASDDDEEVRAYKVDVMRELYNDIRYEAKDRNYCITDLDNIDNTFSKYLKEIDHPGARIFFPEQTGIYGGKAKRTVLDTTHVETFASTSWKLALKVLARDRALLTYTPYRARFHVWNSTALELLKTAKPASIDAVYFVTVTSLWSFSHVGLGALFDEFDKILKPGGKVYMSWRSALDNDDERRLGRFPDFELVKKARFCTCDRIAGMVMNCMRSFKSHVE